MPLILEGIVTTLNEDGTPNISPMGPIVNTEVTAITLRPFQTSQTYLNLRRTGQGVLHVTDDAELLARAAVSQLDPLPQLMPAKTVAGVVLTDACRWYEFQVDEIDEREARTRLQCSVVGTGRIREFFGWNRAKHAVLEAAILATRIGLVPAQQIQAEFQRLRVLVDKTAGDSEERAFRFLEEYVRSRTDLDA